MVLPNGQAPLLTEKNYQESYLRFQDRQAGVSLVYDPEKDAYHYNAYCLEIRNLKELFTVEFDFLEQALEMINEEFSTWKLISFNGKSGCGSCVAK